MKDDGVWFKCLSKQWDISSKLVSIDETGMKVKLIIITIPVVSTLLPVIFTGKLWLFTELVESLIVFSWTTCGHFVSSPRSSLHHGVLLYSQIPRLTSTVTILAPNHNYTLNKLWTNSERTQRTLREHSENTQRTLREHSKTTQRPLAERTHVPRRAIAIFEISFQPLKNCG